MTGGRRALSLTATLVASACTPDPPCGLQLCDVRDADCQRITAEAAACLRGVEPAMVPVAVVSRDDYLAAAAPMLPPEEEEAFRRWNAGLAALDLAPADNTPAAAGTASSTLVTGFYSSRDKQITLIDDGRPLDGWSFIALLAHEFTHAIQDARFDLAQYHATHDTDLDRALAAGAVTEGDATYIGDLTAAGFFGLRSGDIPWAEVFGRWQNTARGQARSSPLPVTLSWSHFRYPFGTWFTKAAFDAGGGAGIDALFAAPPTGTRQVIAGFGAVEPGGQAWADDLGADAVPILDASFEYVAAERMGAWLFEAFLNRVAPGVYGTAGRPQELRGDVLSVFHHQPTGGAVAVWRLRLVSGIDADVALQEVALMLPAARSGQTDNRDLVIVAASDAATLAAVPFTPDYQAIPPATPAAAPLAAQFGYGCVQPGP